MWRKKIKNFIFEDPKEIKETLHDLGMITHDDMANLEEKATIQKALAHFCVVCNRGFKTIGATGAHKRLKHGNK